MAQGQGNFGNPEQHRKAGKMSGGNTRSSQTTTGKKTTKTQTMGTKRGGQSNRTDTTDTTDS